MKRGGEPEEVARAILWLLSDEASYSTTEHSGRHRREVTGAARVLSEHQSYPNISQLRVR